MSDERKDEMKAAGETKAAELKDVGAGPEVLREAGAAGSIDMLMDVTLNVRIELGRARMSVEEIVIHC